MNIKSGIHRRLRIASDFFLSVMKDNAIIIFLGQHSIFIFE